MMRIGKILVPVDFSERAVAAAKHAVALGRHFGSGLIFLHAIPPAPPEYAGFEGGYYTARLGPIGEETVAYFTRQIEALAAKAGADFNLIEPVIREGDPAKEIERVAKEHAVDLIVMPTHGYGRFRRFVLGSVTAKVLHDIETPVFTGAHVLEGDGEPRPFQRVACAVDLRAHSEKVLHWAACFAGSYNAELLLLHAAPSLEVSGTAGQYLGAEWRGVLIQSARQQAEELIARVGCRAEIWIDTADVTEYVPHAAAAAGADLLVIGRSVKEGLVGRLRTNAYALIRESRCPVISV